MAHNGQRLRGLLVRSCTALVLLTSPAFAADDQDPAPSSSTQPGTSAIPANPDFMLGRPRASIGVRGNWIVASAGSDIYDFITEQLTVDKSDFNTASFAADLAISVSPRLDVVGGLDMSKMTQPSHYRGFSEVINGRDMPIQQTTELQQTNFGGSVRFAVVPRGRAISRYAWVPTSVVPYVGGGAGVTKYEFRQFGDFVDFADNDIFTETFTSSGWAPSMHVLAGTDIQLFKQLFLALEGRYTWVHAELGRDFIDFEPMDLGGFRFGAGINFVFGR